MKKKFSYLILLVLSLTLLTLTKVNAQTLEPEVEEVVRNTSSIQNEYDSGFGFNIGMNNFGFGLGGE